jgi:hypothetical protein
VIPVSVEEKDRPAHGVLLGNQFEKTKSFAVWGLAEDERNDLDSVPGIGGRPDFIRSGL